MNLNMQQYYDSLRKMLSDKDLRILFWRIIVEDCKVFQEDFPVNATSYCLLAKQEVGKRLLADAKKENAAAVFTAEADYNEFMEQVARLNETQHKESE